MLALLEVLQFGLIAGHHLYPACLVEGNGFPAALGIVLILQSVLDDLKLQLSHRTDNLASVELVDEELSHTLVHELVDTLLQLLGLHGVSVLDVLEHLGREGGQSAEMYDLTLGQRVTYLEGAVVGQTHDVARPSLIDGGLALGHELRGRGEAQGLVVADMQIGRIAHELAGAHLAEGYTAAVVGVDVGRYLEDEPRELLLVGIYKPFLGLSGSGRRCYLDEAIQEFLHTEVVEGRTEEHGSHLGTEVGRLRASLLADGLFERGIDSLYHLQVLAQLLCIVLAHSLIEFR